MSAAWTRAQFFLLSQGSQGSALSADDQMLASIFPRGNLSTGKNVCGRMGAFFPSDPGGQNDDTHRFDRAGKGKSEKQGMTIIEFI